MSSPHCALHAVLPCTPTSQCIHEPPLSAMPPYLVPHICSLTLCASPISPHPCLRRPQLKGSGVTMTALLAKATAVALAQHPAVNAGCYQGSSFAFNASVNVAVAVAMDGGLITPVLKDADKVRAGGAAAEVFSMDQVHAHERTTRIAAVAGYCLHADVPSLIPRSRTHQLPRFSTPLFTLLHPRIHPSLVQHSLFGAC